MNPECLAKDDGFFCTLYPGHFGDHVAEDIYDTVVHTWPNPDDSPKTTSGGMEAWHIGAAGTMF